MNRRERLTDDQRAILRVMARERGDGHMIAVWIAESCGHYYDTPWANSRLPSLIKRGLISRLGDGWYAITDAGRSLLQNPGDER
jgi:hypothetical protein